MNYDDIHAELDAARRELAYADSVAEQRDMLAAEAGRLEAELRQAHDRAESLTERLGIAEGVITAVREVMDDMRVTAGMLPDSAIDGKAVAHFAAEIDAALSGDTPTEGRP